MEMVGFGGCALFFYQITNGDLSKQVLVLLLFSFGRYILFDNLIKQPLFRGLCLLLFLDKAFGLRLQWIWSVRCVAAFAHNLPAVSLLLCRGVLPRKPVILHPSPSLHSPPLRSPRLPLANYEFRGVVSSLVGPDRKPQMPKILENCTYKSVQ